MSDRLKPFDLTEFRDSGLLYLANRTLHVFGVALSATVQEDGTVTEIGVVETSDPLGLTYAAADEDEARTRLFDWLLRRLGR